MILFLFGENVFLANRKLQEIIEKYRQKYKSGLNFLKIEASEEGIEELKKVAETISMFGEKKLIIFENPFSLSKTLQEELKNYLSKSPILTSKEVFLVFFHKGDVSKKTSLFNFLLKKSYRKQKFEKLSPIKIFHFIQKEALRFGSRIDKEATQKLIFFYGDDLWQISNEVQKLATYKKNKLITSQDVDSLCVAEINPNIFETIEAISKKEKRKALKLFADHLKKGENELRILAMIVFQFRTMIKLKSLIEKHSTRSVLKLQKLSGLHPFVIKKTLPLLSQFSLEDLKKLYQKLLALDFKIKTGKIDPKLALQMFILSL